MELTNDYKTNDYKTNDYKTNDYKTNDYKTNDYKTINTKIPIENIVNNVILSNPISECQFNNLMTIIFISLFINDLDKQINNIKGGKNNLNRKPKNNRKSKNTLKTYNKKKKRSKTMKSSNFQKGGFNPLLTIVLMTVFLTFAKGIKNITDIDVIKRIKDANSVSDLFVNKYGTCTLNTLLFLKAIDLPTFEDLSIEMLDKPGLTRNQINPYLNKELNVDTKWYTFVPSGLDENIGEKIIIDNYVSRIKNKLIQLRQEYDFKPNQSLLTAFSYPSKMSDSGHSVILWLDSNNNVLLIEPQKFQKYDIILYTSDEYPDYYYNNDKTLKLASLRTYIKEHIDFMSNYRESEIFVSLHVELDDIKGSNKLVPTNPKLIKVLTNIREATYSKKEYPL